MIITIDGHASAGKGTLCSGLSSKLRLAHLDTGKTFRYVALNALLKGISDEDSVCKMIDNLVFDYNEIVKNKSLYGDDIAELASNLSQFPLLRKKMVLIQRSLVDTVKGCVVDGRDAGSVVFPDADFKFFITASPHIRSRRRFMELRSRGKNVMYSQVMERILLRDLRDSLRLSSPLRVPQGAFCFDTSSVSPPEVVKEVLDIIQGDLNCDRH